MDARKILVLGAQTTYYDVLKTSKRHLKKILEKCLLGVLCLDLRRL